MNRTLHSRAPALGGAPMPWPSAKPMDSANDFQAVSTDLLTWPFDAMRQQYATAVRAGLIERSILASRDFEVAVARLERWSLGPFARRV